MNPIEELKVDPGNMLFNYDPDCRKIAEDAIRLAGIYRRLAQENYFTKEAKDMVDEDASQLFQWNKK